MIVIYTASFGPRADIIRTPVKQQDGVKCYAFVDDPSKYSGEKGIECHEGCFTIHNPRRRARWHKCNPHILFPDAEYTLWLDGNFQMVTDVTVLIEKYLNNNDICTFKHPWRDCIYNEAATCIALKNDDPKIIQAQMEKLHAESYPVNNGLAATMQILRRRSISTVKFNQLWWSMIENGSQRDQLSFDYACWKLRIKYNTFAGHCYSSDYFKHNQHGGVVR